MSKENDDQAYWNEKYNKITTSMGKWIGGEDVKIRQYSLFKDLFGKVSYMQIIVLNITGRLISKELSTWLENHFMCLSYPDARIWCNQIGAFAGVSGSSPTAATVAGLLGADSRAYGGSYSSFLAMEYIQSALKESKAGKSTLDIINSAPLKHGKPALMGFVRPVNKKDERIVPHQELTKSLGFYDGEHMLLAKEISGILEDGYGSGINIGGYSAAFLSDQGFTAEQSYQIKCISVANGITASYVDNLKNNSNEFLPLKCSDIEYKGKKIRSL